MQLHSTLPVRTPQRTVDCESTLPQGGVTPRHYPSPTAGMPEGKWKMCHHL